MADSVFVALWFFVAAFILFMLFSKRGRKKAITAMFPGAKMLADYGELGSESIRLGTQKLHVYGMEDASGRFLAIENRQTVPLAYQITWLRLDEESLGELGQHLQSLKLEKPA